MRRRIIGTALSTIPAPMRRQTTNTSAVERRNRERDAHRTLGSTGEKVSVSGIGGSYIGLNGVDEQLSLRILRTSVDRGITFMDNCWDYNEGASEIRMGKALGDGYRDRVFL